jgi:hypothetical protein
MPSSKPVQYPGGQDGRVMVWITEPESVQNPVRELLPIGTGGFEYGCRGAGTSDLALALLADCLDETPTAEELRQSKIPYRCVIFRAVFVLDVLAKLPPEYPWSIGEGFLHAWIERERGR